MTRKRISWKPTQSFKRGLAKLCVTDTYIKNKQRANLQVKGEFSFPLYFLLKKNLILNSVVWPEENSNIISRHECCLLPASITFTRGSQEQSSAGAKTVSRCSPRETWIKAPWEFAVTLPLFVQSIPHKWTSESVSFSFLSPNTHNRNYTQLAKSPTLKVLRFDFRWEKMLLKKQQLFFLFSNKVYKILFAWICFISFHAM